MKLLIFSGIVSGYKGLVAGGMNLTIETNEMNPKDTALIVGLHRKPVKVMIEQGLIEADNLGFSQDDFEEFTNKQFDELDSRQTKTPSQRMRNVLYVLYEQDTEGYTNFKDYYDYKLEKVITWLKEKIEE